MKAWGMLRLGVLALILSFLGAFCLGYGFMVGVASYKPTAPLPFCQVMGPPVRP